MRLAVIRADHVGSLLRPPALIEARAAFEQGGMTAEGLREAEDAAIRQILAMQRGVGLQIVTDGEFRRTSWLGGFRDAVRGLVTVEGGSRRQWQGPHGEVANAAIPLAPVAVGAKLRMEGRFTATETAFLKANAATPFKITMPSPSMMLQLFRPGVSDQVYPTPEAMLADLIAIYQREIEALVVEGVPYIQLDSLKYNEIFDVRGREARARGVDLTDVLDQTIAADNALLRWIRRGHGISAIHICRGNHRSAWGSEGGYEPVAERLFNDVEADRFLLEFDDERSGDFAPLRFVPPGKTVVLGLVTTKEGALESEDTLIRRVDEAAAYVPLEQLALSPQCGFASTHLGNLLTADEQRRKLDLVVRTAGRIWG